MKNHITVERIILTLAFISPARILAALTVTLGVFFGMAFFVCAGTEQSELFPDFTAYGTVRYQFFPNGKPAVDFTNQFTVRFSQCKYSIFLNGKRPNAGRLEGLECVFDGTSCYMTRRYSTNPISKINTLQGQNVIQRDLEHPVKPKNDANLFISSGPVPPAMDYGVTALWLGFASHCYYNLNTNEFHDPLTFLGPVYSRHNIKLKARMRLGEHSPHFLEHREDYHEGKIFSEKGKTLAFEPLPKALMSGFTNSVFAVTAWSELLGLYFPKRMEFKTFAVAPSREGTEPRGYCTAEISSVEMAENTNSITPAIPPNTQIRESRPSVVGSREAKYYFSKDGDVQTNFARISEMNKQVDPGARGQPGLVLKKQHRRTVVLWILIALASAPFVFLAARRVLR